MVKMKPLLGSIKGVTFFQQYEDPIPEYDTTVVYDNHRRMQSAQQPGATSVGYPPLYPRTNPKVTTIAVSVSTDDSTAAVSLPAVNGTTTASTSNAAFQSAAAPSDTS